MSRRDLAFGLAAGALAGVMGGWTAARAATSPPPAPLVASAPSARDDAPPCPPCPAAPASDPTVAAQDEEIAALSDLAFGRPLVWPDPIWATWHEEAIRAAVADCAPVVTLVESDCSEPPCLVALDVAAEDGHRLSDHCA